MRDTILTTRRKKTELITLFLCFIIANLANLYSIFTYNTPLTGIITSFSYVPILSVALYIIWSPLRIPFYGTAALFKKKKER